MDLQTATHTRQLKINGQRRSWDVTGVITNTEQHNKKETTTRLVWEFTITFYGLGDEDFLKYEIITRRRFFINERSSIIKRLTKAQQIALKVATLNDRLALLISKNYGLHLVQNVSELQDKWQAIKADLLKDHPGMEHMVSDFSWQLQSENIQEVYRRDNFLNFFFADFFYKPLDDKNALQRTKMVANALGEIDVPIKEEVKISKENILFSQVTIKVDGHLDVKSPHFSIDKMNAFLGDLTARTGCQETLEFAYQGAYDIRPQEGLIHKGTLTYETKIGEVYRKEMEYTFNLENYE